MWNCLAYDEGYHFFGRVAVYRLCCVCSSVQWIQRSKILLYTNNCQTPIKSNTVYLQATPFQQIITASLTSSQ